ncbi:MAG: DUF5654 family protein [Nanoarchaeota archaeon]|nr:DUF5654 family protein [Nanoarchaeota archaeon]
MKEKKDVILNLKNKLIIFEQELKNDVSIPVIASFGFMIALLWRDAIKSTLNTFVSRTGLLQEAYIYDIFSAIIVTIFLSVFMIFLTRFSRKRKEERIKEKVKSLKTK